MSLKIKSCDIKYTIFKKEDLPSIDQPSICIIGRSNVGKSSFINTILERKNIAYVSSRPGKTRSLNFYHINNLFYLIDFPGYGYGAVSSLTKKGWNDLIDGFFNKEQIKRYAFFLIDSRRKVDSLDEDLIEYLKSNDLPILYILTKIDKIAKNKISGIKSYFVEKFSCDRELVIPFSSLTKVGKDLILNYIENIVL